LVALLTGLGVFAYKQMIVTIAHSQQRGDSELFALSWLRSSVGATVWYVVYDDDRFNRRAENFRLFYHGDDRSVRFVSRQSVRYDGRTVVAEIRCEDSKLVLDESPLYGPQDYLHPGIAPDAHKATVLFDGLRACRLDYRLATGGTFQKNVQNTIPLSVRLTYQTRMDEKPREAVFGIRSRMPDAVEWTQNDIRRDYEE
jgi:hypothetical protein